MENWFIPLSFCSYSTVKSCGIFSKLFKHRAACLFALLWVLHQRAEILGIKFDKYEIGSKLCKPDDRMVEDAKIPRTEEGLIKLDMDEYKDIREPIGEEEAAKLFNKTYQRILWMVK